jgi:hypothetical protein
MGFFDELPAPEPEPPRRRHHPWNPPEAEFPGRVATDTLLLGRTEQIAVAITAISAYAAGFELFVTARIRPGTPGDPGAARKSFRFGMQLADGTKVISPHGLGRGRPDLDSEPAGPVLLPFMGGGGPHSMFSRWWAWPLPPSGPLGVICEWTDFGIPETRADIDAQLILDGARRSIRLWSEDEG